MAFPAICLYWIKVGFTCLSIAESSQTNKAQCSYTRQIYEDCKYLLNAVNIAHTFMPWSHNAHTTVNI